MLGALLARLPLTAGVVPAAEPHAESDEAAAARHAAARLPLLQAMLARLHATGFCRETVMLAECVEALGALLPPQRALKVSDHAWTLCEAPLADGASGARPPFAPRPPAPPA